MNERTGAGRSCRCREVEGCGAQRAGLRGSYDFDIQGVETRLSVAIDNVLDTDPKIVPATVNTVPYRGSSAVTRLDLYDALGRSFRVGLRARF